MTAPAGIGFPENTKEGGDALRGRASLLLLNVLGGLAVLGSYALGLSTHPGMGDAVWGGVPQELRPLYTVNMLLATAGYFAFSHFVFFRLDPRRTRIGARLDGVLRRMSIDRFGYARDMAEFSILSEEWPPIKAGLIARLGYGP